MCAAFGASFTFGLLCFAWGFTTFVGDDLSAFWLIRTVPPGTYLTSLLGGQLVVLHRALTWLIYTIAPMKFWLAVLLLGGFHTVAAIYLYRTLQMLKPSRLNAVLVAYYLSNVFTGLQFTWWSSGLTRLAYAALGMATLYHYVAYRLGVRVRNLVLAAIAAILSLGFYSKGLLLPFYCAAADLAFIRDAPGGTRARRLALWTLASVIALGVVYGVVARSLLPPGYEQLHLAPDFLGLFLWDCWTVFSAGCFDHILKPTSGHPWLWLLPIGLFAIYCVLRVRATRLTWALLVALVSANFLFMGISSRTILFGSSVAFQYRHYFDVWFVFLLFLGSVLHRVTETRPALSARPIAGVLATGVALIAHGGSSVWALHNLLQPRPFNTAALGSIDQIELGFYRAMPDSRAFLDNLQHGLAKLPKGTREPTFVNGSFPVSLDPLDFAFRKYSQLFVVLGVRARFVTEPERAMYRIDDSGHVIRVRYSG